MAKKQKAFCINWYPNDYLSGTMYFDLEEKGGYVELLMLQCNTGRFTVEQANKVLGASFPKVWKICAEKFETDGTHYWNARMSLEIEKKKSFSDSRKKNREGSNEPHMETETVTGFCIPVLSEVVEHFSAIGLNGRAAEEAEKFIFFYTSKGWMVGKNKMKDWKAACQTWKRNVRPQQGGKSIENYLEVNEQAKKELREQFDGS